MNKHNKANSAKLAIFASGEGSNFEVLAQQCAPAVALLVTNNPHSPALLKAKRYNVPVFVSDHKKFDSRNSHENSILERLKQDFLEQPQEQSSSLKAIVLAGYMRVLSPWFLDQCRLHWPKCRIINLHPAYLFEYKGAHAYTTALNRKASRWGLTVHEVTEDLDSGPVVLCKEHPIYPHESLVEMKQRFKKFEHSLISSAVKLIMKELP